jgi:hypothetical protein
MTASPEPTVELQRDVQRLLGHCLLQLQQYECSVKAMVAGHELAGPIHALADRRAARVEALSDQTLGMVVNSLFDSCVVPEGFDRELLPDDKAPVDRISVAFSFRLSLKQESWARTKAAARELVTLRNDMVHHFLERFDLQSEDGCRAASGFLENARERIHHHREELLGWATAMEAARENAAALLQTEAVRKLIVDGIAPDGSFDWPATGIVSVLREACHTLAVEGWMALDDALAWITTHHPEQTPAKYGCRTWPQVLSESRQFDLQYRLHAGGKAAWFRCRT